VKEIRIQEEKQKILNEKKTPFPGDYFILNSLTKKRKKSQYRKVKKPSP